MLIILGILFFSLQGCTHTDYVPVPGAAGTNGTNGIAGTTSCEKCHATAHRDSIATAFSLSKHSFGTSVSRGTGASTSFSDGSLNTGSTQFCSQCHTSEGYIDKAKYGSTNPNGYSLTTKISCEACHGTTHRSFNFTADGNDYGLRRVFPVAFMSGAASTTLDASLDGKKNTANTCIACHQSRPADGISSFFKKPDLTLAEKDFTGTTNVIQNVTSPTYKYWSVRALNKAVNGFPASTINYRTYNNSSPSVHDSPQGDIWLGKAGIDIDGTTTHLPDNKITASHYTKGVSCITCHYDKPKADGTKGSHSALLSYVSCKACHTAGDAEAKVTALNTFTDAEMLKLVAAFGKYPTYFTVNAAGTSASLNLTKDDSGANWPTAITNGPLAGTWSVSRTMPLKYAQAYWNYQVLKSGHNGVHNPTYFKALIQNSIEALK
jgi:hypothetical protein